MNVSDLADLDLHCPFCYGKFLRAKHQTETPHKGDLAFCQGCGNVGVFTDRDQRRRAWTVRKPTPGERREIASHQAVNALRQQWATRGMH